MKLWRIEINTMIVILQISQKKTTVNDDFFFSSFKTYFIQKKCNGLQSLLLVGMNYSTE